MDKLKKNIIILIVSMIILIIIIILGILLLNKKQEENNNVAINESDPGEEVDFENSQLHDLTDKNQYYTVRNCINAFIKSLYNDNSIYYLGEEKEEELQKEYVYNLIDSEYRKNNSITEENVLTKIKTFDEEKLFVPIKMKVLEKENVYKYVAYGVITNLSNYQDAQEIYIMVNLDNNNNTFSIEPVNKNYNSIDEINVENENSLIEENDNNSYKVQSVTNEYIANEYFVLYKRLALSDPELLYNMFSNEYKGVRFGSLNEFKNYINNNKEEIMKINMGQYLVDTYDEYTEFVAKDQFGNYYVFDENNSKGDVDIRLDTYTIPTEKFKTEYDKAESEKKVQMNIDKFIQMVNRHDYKTSYNCIADGFKNNYFDTQDKFENYIKNAFFEYNNFEFENIQQKGNNLYTCTVTLTDLTGNSNDTKKITIIMQLNDNYDFKMSFSV